MWYEGFMNALSGMNILWLLVGSGIGLVIGVLPALGATFGITLMLPFTFGMDPAAAMVMLCALHAACNYGDSITSILLNVPGGPGTLATCWDGYPLSQQGRGGEAIGIATLSSFIGGVATWFLLAFTVAPITKLALSFGSPEYFALALMALGLISVASKGETLKGLVMSCVGLAFSTIGQDEVMGTTFRFAYGIPWLEGGIPLMVAALGLFALAQVIRLLEEGGTIAKCEEIKDSLLKGFASTLRRPVTLLRASGVGAFIGVLPALGVTLAGIAAYFTEKKYSKEASDFGKGSPAGVVAAEAGKGACVIGDLIPTFTLGVPGSVSGAILMAALIMQGIQPGPQFLLKGALPYTVFASLLLAQATFLITGLAIGKWLCRMVYLPNTVLAPILAVLVFLGSYTAQNSGFDILLTLLFGLFSYILGKIGYPVVCLMLGLILGRLLEAHFHRSLAENFGSYSAFLNRPMVVSMFVITALFLFGPYIISFLRRYRKQPPGILGEAIEGGTKTRGHKGEAVLLLAVILGFLVFLLTALRYSSSVRLFPDLICVLGLVFSVWRLVIVFVHLFTDRESDKGRGKILAGFSFFQGRLSWQLSFVTLAGYVLSIYLLGFPIASACYMGAVVTIAAGYQRWKYLLLIAILVGMAVVIISKAAHLLLPLGYLTGL